MKFSNKIIIVFLAVAAFAALGHTFAVRMAYAQKSRIDFRPGYVEKSVQPFKVIVLDSKLSAISDLEIRKGSRFALASDQNFWNAATVSQSGDTLFIRQTADKCGRIDDSDDRDVNNYANITVLCPPGLRAVRSDVGISFHDIESDSLVAVQITRHTADDKAPVSEIVVKNCKIGHFSANLEADNSLEIQKENEITHLALTLRDSSDADIIAPISGSIRIDCGHNSHVSMDGVNLMKVVKN